MNSMIPGILTCRLPSGFTVWSSQPDREPSFIYRIALTATLFILRFQTAMHRILLCEVSQAALESGIEGIDTVSIIAFTGQDNSFLLIFRKSGHSIVFSLKIAGLEPPIRKGLTAPVLLPAAVQFSVSVFYSEIPQVISLDSPKLIDLPGLGQEILILLGFEDIHSSDLRCQVMDDLLQVQIHRYMLDIAEPENRVSAALVPKSGEDLLPGEVSPRAVSGSLPGHLLIVLLHADDVFFRLKPDLVDELLKLLIRDTDTLDQVRKVHQDRFGQFALAHAGGDDQVGPGANLVLLAKSEESVLLGFRECDAVKQSVHGLYHPFIKMIDCCPISKAASP